MHLAELKFDEQNCRAKNEEQDRVGKGLNRKLRPLFIKGRVP
jgi:hypothetical protein